MAEILNLTRLRKLRARDEERREADANSVKFGQTKAGKIALAARGEKARKMLDQHKLDEE